MSSRVDYWLELAEYDLETANVMLKGGRYLYVGFMCHQVIEKAFKAYYVKATGETPPYTHNLELLATKATLYPSFSEDQTEFIRRIEPMNIEARYPADRDLLAKALTQDKCQWFLARTEELFQWIKQRLSE